MKLLGVALLASVLLTAVECQIIVNPVGNTTVPAGSDVNVTYSRTVPSGTIVEWLFGIIQLSPDSSNAQLLAENGLFLDPPTEEVMTNIIVTPLGRERLGNNIQLRCSSLQQRPEIDIMLGDIFYVRTFDIPNPPENFAFNPVPEDTSRLVLSWDQPLGTVIDSDDPVITTYTVTVTGPTFNFVNTTTGTSFEFIDELDQPCAMHEFFVSASNEAGQGMNVSRTETIPISPDIRALNTSLRVSHIDLSRGGVAVDVTFTAATICSENFPLTNYSVTVIIGNETDTSTYLVSDPRIMDQEVITLPVPNDRLTQDQEYEVTVTACVTVTCRTTSPAVPFRTTDVQSASITFFDTNVFLECIFVNVIAGLGCAFRLETANGDVETLTVPVGEGEQCSMTLNMENAYTNIEAVDWIAEDVFGTEPTTVTINPIITDATNYTMQTGCIPPTPVEALSGGAIAGITIGVIVAVLFILGVVIAVAVIEYKRRVSKRPKIKRTDEEKVSVDFDKQWLMEDELLPNRRGSLRRGRSIVDGTEEASLSFRTTKEVAAAGSPPSIASVATNQPSLTNLEPAFSLHIDRDQKKARLHLNRALIRRALKEQRMRTLEKQIAKSKPNQSLRQLLLPLHSEVHITGEESDEETTQHDGEGDADHMIASL